MELKINCPFCLEEFEILCYPEDGEEQSFVYDCEICCHPIDLHVDFSAEEPALVVEASTGF